MNKRKTGRLSAAEELGEALLILQAAGAQFRFDGAVEPTLLPVREVAEILSVKPEWVREHLAEFPGTVRLPGEELRIPASDIEAAIKRWRRASISDEKKREL